jgi:hypothetical protein
MQTMNQREGRGGIIDIYLFRVGQGSRRNRHGPPSTGARDARADSLAPLPHGEGRGSPLIGRLAVWLAARTRASRSFARAGSASMGSELVPRGGSWFSLV